MTNNKRTVLTDIMKFSHNEGELKRELENKLSFNAVKNSIPNSNMSFYKLNILIENEDKTLGDLIIALDESYCFGISENRDLSNGSISGYSAGISLLSRDKLTEKQQQTIRFINVLSDIIREYLLSDEGKVVVENYDIEAPLLKKINPLYFKRDKGKIVEGSSPTFYPKLMYQKATPNKQENLYTRFYTKDGERLNPLVFLNTSFLITPAVKFESIYCGKSKFSTQIKLIEADCEPIKRETTERKRLLH